MAINRSPGVYILHNKYNGKEYVGSTNNLFRRQWEHFAKLKANDHYNIHLQRAYNKCPDSLEFKVIKECSTREEALGYEQDYLDVNELYTKGYNRYAKVVYDQRGPSISKALTGSKLSEQHKQNLRGPRLHTRGKNHWHTNPILQLSLNGIIIKIWDTSITQVALELNILRTSIDNCLSKRSKTAGGYKWKYVEND